MMDVVAPGARVVIRDAEWLVRKVDATSTGGYAIHTMGISELVKNREAIFLSELERDITVMDPAETTLVPDTSPHFRHALLYIESLLRQTPPTDPPSEEKIYIGHNAAMDVVGYQLDPAIQALKQPRQRLLIADAVGLGKTLEAGILLAELIRRGRGKRLLVVTLKSMLTQFQKELWARFAIPLVRLDSVGIQRVRHQIPSHHNPFYYFDRAIISIDTLKQDSAYRPFIENCRWDIIVIDEAHNVAERGSSSLRAKLARLLASRSDTLIMLSATPHDGRKASFASLMNMLNPTAIANPDDYGPEDIKGLFIRRFKKDIQHQVQSAFMDRSILKAPCQASAAEEAVFDALTGMTFRRLDQRTSGVRLFKTTLEKALFSSPSACIETARNRVHTLEREDQATSDPVIQEALRHDRDALEELITHVQQIAPTDFSKYQKLLSVIRDTLHGFGWTPTDPTDRLVIFTERIETLRFLQQHLQKDLKLHANQIGVLYGTLPDVDQQRMVEDFGKEGSPVRILIASDIAAEGINLHYLSHRLIHFDIPWSLMVFQQRNGRIDRYGQMQQPQIVYLLTHTQNDKIRGDTRILEVLVEKDQQAYKNIGDPSAFIQVYDIDREEDITAAAIEAGTSAEAFDHELDNTLADDPLAILMGDDEIPTGDDALEHVDDMPSIFADDYAYVKEALAFVKQTRDLQAIFDDNQQFVNLTIPDNFGPRLKNLPQEVKAALQDSREFVLTTNRRKIMDEIARCRKEELAWPRFHLLWDLHPVMEWLNDTVLTAFGRHEAPVITLPRGLQPGEVVFLTTGLIPNRKGQPLIHRWFGICFRHGQFQTIQYLPEILERTGLGRTTIPNPNWDIDIAPLQWLLPRAIAEATTWMSANRDEFNDFVQPKLREHLQELQRLKGRRLEQLEVNFDALSPTAHVQRSRMEAEQRRIEALFAEYQTWIEETMTTEDKPYIRIVAVLRGDQG
jgi:superfamily II DNA or RNA helicase